MGKQADIYFDKSTQTDLQVLEEIFRLLIERGRAVRAAKEPMYEKSPVDREPALGEAGSSEVTNSDLGRKDICHEELYQKKRQRD